MASLNREAFVYMEVTMSISIPDWVEKDKYILYQDKKEKVKDYSYEGTNDPRDDIFVIYFYSGKKAIGYTDIAPLQKLDIDKKIEKLKKHLKYLLDNKKYLCYSLNEYEVDLLNKLDKATSEETANEVFDIYLEEKHKRHMGLIREMWKKKK